MSIGNGEHRDEHDTGRHHAVAEEPAEPPPTLDGIHAVCLVTARKVALVEERSMVWDDSIHALASLHQSVMKLSAVTTDLFHRVKPFTFSRWSQVGLILGASVVGSMLGGGFVVWLVR